MKRCDWDSSLRDIGPHNSKQDLIEDERVMDNFQVPLPEVIQRHQKRLRLGKYH